MALGSSYSSNSSNRSSSSGYNNQNNTMYNPTYYSRISIRNPLDNLRLSFNKSSFSINKKSSSTDGVYIKAKTKLIKNKNMISNTKFIVVKVWK